VPVTPAIIDRVEQLLLEGHNLTEISAMPGMPRRSSISYRVDSDPTLSARIARAREIGWDVRAEKAVMDAKAATDPQKGKLAFDADRWLLSKMNSAKYGERMRNEISGPNGGPLVISDTERASRLASLINLAAQRKEDDQGDLA
jgi:hypothetical protein